MRLHSDNLKKERKEKKRNRRYDTEKPNSRYFQR